MHEGVQVMRPASKSHYISELTTNNSSVALIKHKQKIMNHYIFNKYLQNERESPN